MSPEQARGLPVDGRSDVFAVGVLLYLMLAEKAPFSGKDDFEIMTEVVKCTPQPLLSRNPRLPPGIVSVVEKMLRKEPPERPQTALRAAEDLADEAEPGWGGRQEAVLGRLVSRVRGETDPAASSSDTLIPVYKR